MFALGLREGLEAAVVVATVAVVLRRTRFRRQLFAAVTVAAATCVVVVLLVRSANATASDHTRHVVKLLVATGAVVALTSTARWMLGYGRSTAGTLGASPPVSPAQATALVVTASLAVVREGFELGVLPAASQDPWAPGSLPLLAGVGVATGIGVLAYVAGSRALGVTVRVAAPLLLLIAAGLSTAVVRSAHAALGIDATVAVEIVWLAELPTWLGELTRGLFGWHARPSVAEALVYVAYGIAAASLLLRCWPPPVMTDRSMAWEGDER